jgi:hypothetical protein
MPTVLAYEEDEKLVQIIADAVMKIEEERAETVKNAEKKAEEMVSPFAENVRKNIEKRGSIMKIHISKFRLVKAALEAVQVLEAAKALTISSIGERFSELAESRDRLEEAIRENDSRLSYWKAYNESVVAKWKFVEKAEFFGMSIKDMLVIAYSNPYLGTYSEEETVMSCRYWTEQTDKIMIDY